MDITLCGQCGWLGTTAEVASQRKEPTNPHFKAIVASNGLSCKCCPECGSSELFTKPFVAPFQTFQAPTAMTVPRSRTQAVAEEAEPLPAPEPQVSTRPAHIPSPDQEPQISIEDSVAEEEADAGFSSEELELTDDVVSGVLAEAEAPGVVEEEEPEPIEEEVPKAPPAPKRPPVQPKNFACDICGKTFKSKFETNRCAECYKEMKKMYGGG